MRSIPIGAVATALALSLAACTFSTVVQAPPAPFIPSPSPSVMSKAALSGQKQKLAQFYSVTPDCGTNFKPIIKITKQPLNGVVSVEETTGYPNFPKENIRSACNMHQVPVVAVYYTSNPAYLGADAIAFDQMDSLGNLKKFDMKIDVR